MRVLWSWSYEVDTTVILQCNERLFALAKLHVIARNDGITHTSFISDITVGGRAVGMQYCTGGKLQFCLTLHHISVVWSLLYFLTHTHLWGNNWINALCTCRDWPALYTHMIMFPRMISKRIVLALVGTGINLSSLLAVLRLSLFCYYCLLSSAGGVNREIDSWHCKCTPDEF